MKKFYLFIFFNTRACFLQSPPLTNPHLNESQVFIVCKVLVQLIEFSLFNTTLKEREAYLLTGEKAIKATGCFKNSVAV